jgi:hypothetical protein
MSWKKEKGIKSTWIYQRRYQEKSIDDDLKKALEELKKDKR